ncbi:MAG: hypothetical protein JWP29_112 [Rhodoferax sp.]|nr:hypothetical protein [Rhodoferax sp.]
MKNSFVSPRHMAPVPVVTSAATAPTPARAASSALADVDPRFGLLKVLGSIGVVVVHSTAERVNDVDMDHVGWWLANISNAAGRYGSAIFVMVSGALLLARHSEDKPVEFVRQRFARLLPMIVFWSLFYFAWRALRGADITWESAAKDVVQGMPSYHLWFVYMMLGLYLMAPALRMLVRSPRHRPVQYYALAICAALTCTEAATQTLQQTMHASFIGLSPLFIVYFLGGYLLYRDRPRLPYALLWNVPLASVAAMAIGVALLDKRLGDWAFVLFYSNRAPFAMALTFCLFLAVLRVPQNHALLRCSQPLARISLGIYGVHPFWIDALEMLGCGPTHFESAWVVPAAAAYVLSAATAYGLSQVTGLRRVVQ